MKPATYWRDKLCNRFVLNTKDNTEVIKFIEEIQKDATKDLIDSIENDMLWDANDFVSQDRYDKYKEILNKTKGVV